MLSSKNTREDFRMLKAIGIDHVFVVRTEMEQDGCHLSAENPRSATWPEDECLLDMAFRRCDRYEMSLYLGDALNVTNFHLGDWKKGIEENKRCYERMMAKYAARACFTGFYVSMDGLP